MRLSADESPAQPRIGNLLIVPLGMQITKVNGRYTSQPGFHYVRFTASVKNVGHDALCTVLSATLESTLNVGKRYGHWELKPRNGAATASGGFIHQLLPGEELEATIVFGDLRDGVKPVKLTIESQQQSCGSTVGPDTVPLKFAIRDSAGRAQISLLTSNHAVEDANAKEDANANSPPSKPQHETTKPTVLVSAPKAIYAPDAEYTEAARQAKLSGSVQFRVLVGKDGLVHDAVALNRLGTGLDENAIAAVRQWRFTPAMAEGKPVDLWIIIDMEFRLY